MAIILNGIKTVGRQGNIMDTGLTQRINEKYKNRLLALEKDKLAEIILQADSKLMEINKPPKSEEDNTFLGGIIEARAILLQLAIDAFKEKGIE